MDKLYKPHFLSQLKARMPVELPGFAAHKPPPAGHPLRSRFSGSMLYRQPLPASPRCVWLDWFPGSGVEREFFAYVGWTPSPDLWPVNQPGDLRIHDLTGPTANPACGTLNVQRLEGRQAIGAFSIATPWDQVYRLSPRATDEERTRMMHKAHAEYLAVTDAQRIEAVRQAMNAAFTALHATLPAFIAQLERLTPAA